MFQVKVDGETAGGQTDSPERQVEEGGGGRQHWNSCSYLESVDGDKSYLEQRSTDNTTLGVKFSKERIFKNKEREKIKPERTRTVAWHGPH